MSSNLSSSDLIQGALLEFGVAYVRVVWVREQGRIGTIAVVERVLIRKCYVKHAVCVPGVLVEFRLALRCSRAGILFRMCYFLKTAFCVVG